MIRKKTIAIQKSDAITHPVDEIAVSVPSSPKTILHLRQNSYVVRQILVNLYIILTSTSRRLAIQYLDFLPRPLNTLIAALIATGGIIAAERYAKGDEPSDFIDKKGLDQLTEHDIEIIIPSLNFPKKPSKTMCLAAIPTVFELFCSLAEVIPRHQNDIFSSDSRWYNFVGGTVGSFAIMLTNLLHANRGVNVRFPKSEHNLNDHTGLIPSATPSRALMLDETTRLHDASSPKPIRRHHPTIEHAQPPTDTTVTIRVPSNLSKANWLRVLWELPFYTVGGQSMGAYFDFLFDTPPLFRISGGIIAPVFTELYLYKQTQSEIFPIKDERVALRKKGIVLDTAQSGSTPLMAIMLSSVLQSAINIATTEYLFKENPTNPNTVFNQGLFVIMALNMILTLLNILLHDRL